MLKIDKKLHWNLSNSSLIVYQDTWHYTSQWPSRQRQRQRQQEGWSSAPPLSLGEVFVRFAPFFPQISWHLVIFHYRSINWSYFEQFVQLASIICSPIPVVETLQCLTLHLFVDWKQFFVWSPGKININLVPQFRNDGLVRYNVIYFGKNFF